MNLDYITTEFLLESDKETLENTIRKLESLLEEAEIHSEEYALICFNLKDLENAIKERFDN